jgi:hypothetical protein
MDERERFDAENRAKLVAMTEESGKGYVIPCRADVGAGGDAAASATALA